VKNLVQVGIRATTPEMEAMSRKYRVRTITAREYPEN